MYQELNEKLNQFIKDLLNQIKICKLKANYDECGEYITEIINFSNEELFMFSKKLEKYRNYFYINIILDLLPNNIVDKLITHGDPWILENLSLKVSGEVCLQRFKRINFYYYLNEIIEYLSIIILILFTNLLTVFIVKMGIIVVYALFTITGLIFAVIHVKWEKYYVILRKSKHLNNKLENIDNAANLSWGVILFIFFILFVDYDSYLIQIFFGFILSFSLIFLIGFGYGLFYIYRLHLTNEMFDE